MQKLKNYYNAIDYHDTLSNLDDITNLIQQHIANLPFCNIPVLLKETISLQLEDIIDKMAVDNKGGYCFEHNKLLFEVLKEHDFDVRSYFGRVLLNKKNVSVPKTHRFNVLSFGSERYLIDVGFGPMSPPQPIKFGTTPTQTHLNKSYIIKQIDHARYELQIVTPTDPFTLYAFDLHDYNEMDYEVGHFYSHQHPKAVFVNNLVVSLIKNDVVLSLRNSSYQKIYKEKTDHFQIMTAKQLQEILTTDFNYVINDVDSMYLYENFVSK